MMYLAFIGVIEFHGTYVFGFFITINMKLSRNFTVMCSFLPDVHVMCCDSLL